MRMLTLSFLPALLVVGVGCAEKTAQGTLVDGVTADPIGEMRMIATATTSTPASCSVLETHTDKAGKFEFKGLCADVTYDLKPENENYWLADGHTLTVGQDLELKAYQAPSGSGIYRLLDGELAVVPTHADIKTESVLDDDTQTVSYPVVLPKKPVVVPPNGYLVLTGENIGSMEFHPLIASDERKFGSTKSTLVTMKPWSYIGVAFESDTKLERKEATLDTSKVVEKKDDERSGMWIPGDALPPGRYVIHKDGATRTTVLEFGKPTE